MAMPHRPRISAFTLLVFPGAAFICLNLLLPLAAVLVFSFWRTESYELFPDWNLDNYRTLFTEPDGTASPLTVNSGRLRAYLDMRDGNSAGDIGIPYLMHRLDTLAAAIADSVNTVHSAGWTLPDASNGNVSATGALAGTPTGACVEQLFRGVSVPAFTGDSVTVSRTVSVGN